MSQGGVEVCTDYKTRMGWIRLQTSNIQTVNLVSVMLYCKSTNPKWQCRLRASMLVVDI